MEYVIVKFPTQRNVYIDGKTSGKTNQTLRVEKGCHRFDLGQPADYTPEFKTVTVEKTVELKPLSIEFVSKGKV